MSYQQSNTPMRKFVLTTGPSVADPAWVVAGAELIEPSVSDPAGIKSAVQYSTVVPIIEVVLDIHYKRGFSAGESKGFDKVLESLGLSFEQYAKILDLKKANPNWKLTFTVEAQ